MKDKKSAANNAVKEKASPSWCVSMGVTRGPVHNIHYAVSVTVDETLLDVSLKEVSSLALI